jgi:AAA domain-containing protein
MIDYCEEALGGPAWRRGAFTAAQLQEMEFPPISWIVSNIIPAEGVTLLCSKLKFGKSWLAYDLCIACTMDRFTLGTIKPAQGDVLYLALEDSKRRLQRRMTKLLPTFGATWSEKLTLKTEWRRLHEGGLDDIRAWHADTKAKGGKPMLAVIDVLAKVRKPGGNRQVYEADYEALSGLAKLANELALAILVVHHTRKLAADDLMETVSGSYGVSGAVDTILVMATKASGTVLDIRGRDVESAELAIEFSKESCRWRVLGKAAEVHVSEQRAKIIATLREAGEPMEITALAEATDFGTGTVVRFRSTHAVRSRGPIGSGQPNTLLLSRATPTRSMRTSDARRPTLNYRQSRKSGPRAAMLKFATALITRSPCSNAGACCETARNKVE